MASAGFPPASQHREPIDARQAEVENDSVVAFGLTEEVGALAVGGAVHGIACLRQRARQLIGQRRFILDYQNPHTMLPVRPTVNGLQSTVCRPT